MKEFSIIPENVKRKIELELFRADIKISVNKLFSRSLLYSFALSFIVLLFFRTNLKDAANFTTALINFYIISLLISAFIILFFVYSKITLRKIKRKKEIEDVLADYLQLVSGNLTAGMPIDQAMWYAIRERFGILAQEIEIVARKVMGGSDLEQALVEFTNKYDSDLLKRSMFLLIEGLRSGGELASLVNKIAWNVKETQIIEKEINAETTTYTIFITFASIIIAPFLYSLSHRIIIIMGNIFGKINIDNISGISSTLPLKFSGTAISASDFRIFVLINLGVTSTLAAMIISTIKKGNVKAGLKLIPIFIIVSLILFLIISSGLAILFKEIAF